MAVDPARVKSLFLAASEIADPAERAAFLDRECGADAELQARVEALLRADDSSPLEESEPAAPVPTADYPRTDEQAGTVIAGKYTLVDLIGEGGMGSVWRARQTEPVKRFVAVKLIKAGMDSRQVLTRFEAERQALALMDHPNIAKVLDGGLHQHRPFFVMELVKGVPITDFCDARKLTPKERLELFVPVCQAIQHAHQKGIIHRDIKPSNVLIALYDDKPVVKVIDFGVAKATGGTLTEHTIETGFGGVVGTPQYMSPEQATFNNLDIDTRSDVYALGVLLYELLTGSPPFARKELQKAGLLEILRVVREEEPPRPSAKLSTAEALPSLSANRSTEPKKLTGLLRNELDWIVMKALEKDRTRRYATANGFAADVLRYLGGEAVLAHPPSTAYRLKKFVKRYKGQVIAASLILLALVAGIVGTTLGLLEAKRQEGLARTAAEEERQAKLREAERAEGEKVAKLEAQKNLQQAEANLAFAKKGNDILGSVFTGLDPKKNYATVGEFSQVLKDNLKKAVQELEGSAIGDPLTVAGMQNTLGLSLLGLGEPFQAIILFEKARDTYAANLGPDHPYTLGSMNSLAAGYYGARKLDRALPLMEETLKLTKAKLGPDHPDTLASMNNLAMTYRGSRQLAKAVTLFEETLQKQKAKLGPDHPGTLTTMSQLALAYQDSGQLAKAIPLLEKALNKNIAKLGPDHPNTLVSMNNLAQAYRDSGQLSKAVPLLEEALDKNKAKLGPDHPDTLVSMNNLAAAYSNSRQLAKAVTLLEEVLLKREGKLGPDHPDTLVSMNNLAMAHLHNGQLARAVLLLEEALAKMKAKLGPDHPDTLVSMNNLAMAYRNSRQLARAVPLYEEVLLKQKAKLGPDHPDTLVSMNNLAAAYRNSRQLAKAVTLYEAAAQGIEKRLFQHEGAWHIIPNTIHAYEQAKQYDRADGWRRKWLGFVKEHDGADSPSYTGELAQWGFSLLQRQKWTDAESVLRDCLTIRQKRSPDSWLTFNTQSLLGGSLLGQNKYDAAQPLLLKGYEGMKQREKTIPKGGETRLAEALDRLIEFHTSTNKPEEAKKWRAERAKYPQGKTKTPEKKPEH